MPLNVVVGLLALVKLPPVPFRMDHKPVPTTGVFAPSVTVVKPQVKGPVKEGPPLATVGLSLKMTFISSKEGGHGGGLVIVHRRV